MTDDVAGDRQQVPVRRQYKAGRIKGLDGPRGIACWAVLIVHVATHASPNTMANGKLQLLGQALIFFFALSGFLLYLPYVRGLMEHRPAPPDVRSYAVHRSLRVLPGYLVIFLVVNFILQASFLENEWTASQVGTDAGTGMITDPGMLSTNLLLLQTYFPQYLQTGISPSWSLTLELAFYASLPIFGAAMWALHRRFRMRVTTLVLIPPLVLIAIGVAGKIWAGRLADAEGITTTIEANWGPNWTAVLLRSFIASCDNFAFGMLVTVVFVAVGLGVWTVSVTKARVITAVAMGVSLLVMLYMIAAGSNYQSSATSLASGLLILFIVLPIAAGQRSRLAEALDWKPFEYIGRISLSIYLWHFPVIIVFARNGLLLGDSLGGLLVNIVTVSATSFALASLTYHYVERRAMDYARRFKTSRR